MIYFEGISLDFSAFFFPLSSNVLTNIQLILLNENKICLSSNSVPYLVLEKN